MQVSNLRPLPCEGNPLKALLFFYISFCLCLLILKGIRRGKSFLLSSPVFVCLLYKNYTVDAREKCPLLGHLLFDTIPYQFLCVHCPSLLIVLGRFVNDPIGIYIAIISASKA